VLSKTNKSKRVHFAQRSDLPSPRHLVFIDSKIIHYARDSARNLSFAWQDPRNPVLAPTASNPTPVHFYGAIGHGHRSSLVFVPPTPGVTEQKENFSSKHFIQAFDKLYKEIKSWFPTGTQFWIIMDHAKQHTSRATRSHLEELGAPILWDFPPQSYDINMVEVCWGIMAGRVRGRRPRKLSGFKRVTQEAWAGVPISAINKLVNSWPAHVRAVLERGGQWPSK
jgi:hypothetical protein